MMGKMQQGILITLEGGEGAGKSTQAKLLQDYLVSHGYQVFLTKEPRGNRREEILSLDKRDPRWRKKELALFLEDRAVHFSEEIIPHLQSGDIVISDRCGDSTVAYQGHARGVEQPHVLRAMNQTAMQGIVPHLTILFDLDPAAGRLSVLKRGETPTHFEQEEPHFHASVRQGFLIEAEQWYPKRWFVVNAGQSQEVITNQIVQEIHRRFDI